jgi:hypothetical protein
MDYLNLLTGEIGGADKRTVRRGIEADTQGMKGHAIPTFVVEYSSPRRSGRGSFYAQSPMELVVLFATDLHHIDFPIEVDMQLESNKVIPWNAYEDPKWSVESIALVHNSQVEKYCKPIENNPNPFDQRVYHSLTRRKAEELSGDIKESLQPSPGRVAVLT